MAEFRQVCRVGEVDRGRGLAIEVEGLPIAIFNDGESFHALLGRCPHANGVMGDGWIEDGEVICPIHMWRFQLATGRCTTMRGQSLHKFACEVRGTEVWVEV